jgi:hypothetical protein
MEEMEGWIDSAAHVALVQSAVEGRMNTLRVWGGGMFLPDIWYDACDELGILVYHDMQYAQEGHSPVNTVAQDLELRHQIRRLSHHASIVIWDGCNECQVYMNTSTAVYATFVMTVVAEEDSSRAIWPSCPSMGWATGVHKLTSMPNGNPLTTPYSGRTIEVHGPYLHGTGFPAVNGATKLDLFDSMIPLKLEVTANLGPQSENVFASEFGAVVMSSFESMSVTLAKEHWGLHAGQPSDSCNGNFANECEGDNIMAQRNYPCDNLIYVYFGKRGQNLNATGEQVFKKQLYQCMISQALNVKQSIETTLSRNSLGVITWQLNEIWPTGGWGSLEYGNPKMPGQVVGGRWKPLQYWYRASLYTDVYATCGKDGKCYIRNDAPKAFVGSLVLNVTAFATGEVSTVLEQVVSLRPGGGMVDYFTSAKVAALDGSKHILEAIVMETDGTVVSRNVVPFASPERMLLKPAKVAVAAHRADDGSFVADVTTQAVAMYVTLTTLANGRFEDNAFLLVPPGRQLKFLPSTMTANSMDEEFHAFAQSLRVEDVSLYQSALTFEAEIVI